MNREKTTATILIAIFMISTMAFAIPIVSATGTVTNLDTSETFATIQLAIDDAETLNGHTIEVGAGDWFGAIVTKSLEIKGKDGAVIDDGPTHGSWKDGFRLVSGSSGATISHFTFRVVELPIYGWGPDDVTIEHNKIYDTMQGITNFDGDGWVIRQNVIEGIWTMGSGGIGICIGSRNSPISGNVITHNKIVAHIDHDYTFSTGGILLCTDERYGWNPGAVTDNKIVHNKVKITGTKTWAMALQVIGLSEYPVVDPEEIIYAKGMLHDNIVGFNDLRGSDLPISLLPKGLRNVNTISRNLGENYEIWSLVGEWELDFDVGGTPYKHYMSITEEIDTAFSGTGTNSHEWVVTGTKFGASIEMVIDYDNSDYLVGVIGTMDSDGKMSGTWATNAGQSGTWKSTDGLAILQDQAVGVNRGHGEVPANVFKPVV